MSFFEIVQLIHGFYFSLSSSSLFFCSRREIAEALRERKKFIACVLYCKIDEIGLNIDEMLIKATILQGFGKGKG
ncbi:hypothetical protein BCY86_00625 [Pajaroellobacter abortibovis]|uniref:Uncharacterized protein n=2 Tax=Pajaroellobacter abortibovis TaxID=1882918 RepID=A0A1L6MV30_9BACT|nr:hypothetical protein BCY86_00625 [Pajaroellobacter abortibovis]